MSNLRIGLFLSNIHQPANWELYVLKKIHQCPNIDLVLLLANKKQKKRSPISFTKLLLNWQISAETNLISKKNELKSKEIYLKEALATIPKIIIVPSENTLKINTAIAPYQLDILIDLSIGVFNKKWASGAKYSLWQLHFGDLSINKEAPIGFWETHLKVPLTEIYLLQQLSTGNDKRLINHGCYFRWKTWSKNNSSLLDHVAGLVVKSLEEHQPNSIYQPLSPKPTLLKVPSITTLLKHMFGFWKAYWMEQSGKGIGFNEQRWTLFIGKGKFQEANLSQLIQIPLPKDEFWADPFLFNHGSDLYIFFECYPNSTNKGIICCGKLVNNQLEEIQVILDLPYHLSYPFVFEEDGEIYMIPETCKNKRLEIYKCTSFPNKWELFSKGFEGESVADTTYYQDKNGDRWLFLNKAVLNNGHNTELHIFQIDSLQLKNIKPHLKNPVIIDARKARCGGAIFLDGDKVIRPSQNNSMGIYGYGLNLNEILNLSLEAYEEKTIKQIYPNFHKDIIATHHLHQLEHFFVIDAISNYPK